MNKQGPGEVSKVTVYVVTEGSYGDYRVRAIFSSRAKAEEWIKQLKGYGNVNEEVEEFVLDSAPTPKLGYQIIMDRKGSVDAAGVEEIGKYNEYGFSHFAFAYSNPDERSLVWNVNTLDEERAIEIVNEKRSRILALGIWGDDKAVREREEAEVKKCRHSWRYPVAWERVCQRCGVHQELTLERKEKP